MAWSNYPNEKVNEKILNCLLSFACVLSDLQLQTYTDQSREEREDVMMLQSDVT